MLPTPLSRFEEINPKDQLSPPSRGADSIMPLNNAAERSLRGIAMGRKSWLFAGSDRGGERAAVIYTLIQTAKLNDIDPQRSEEHTSELQSLMRISYAVFCLKKKKTNYTNKYQHHT